MMVNGSDKRLEALKKYLKNKNFKSYSSKDFTFDYKIKGLKKDSHHYFHVNISINNLKSTTTNRKIPKNCGNSIKRWYNFNIRTIVYFEMKSLFDIFGYGSNFGRVDIVNWEN